MLVGGEAIAASVEYSGPGPKPTANSCTPCALAAVAAAIAAASPPSTVCTPSVSTSIVTGTPSRAALSSPSASVMPSEIDVPPEDGPPPRIALSMSATLDESASSTSASPLNCNWVRVRICTGVSTSTNPLTRMLKHMVRVYTCVCRNVTRDRPRRHVHQPARARRA